jgi:hypothetical protein
MDTNNVELVAAARLIAVVCEVQARGLHMEIGPVEGPPVFGRGSLVYCKVWDDLNTGTFVEERESFVDQAVWNAWTRFCTTGIR